MSDRWCPICRGAKRPADAMCLACAITHKGPDHRPLKGTLNGYRWVWCAACGFDGGWPCETVLARMRDKR